MVDICLRQRQQQSRYIPIQSSISVSTIASCVQLQTHTQHMYGSREFAHLNNYRMWCVTDSASEAVQERWWNWKFRFVVRLSNQRYAPFPYKIHHLIWLRIARCNNTQTFAMVTFIQNNFFSTLPIVHICWLTQRHITISANNSETQPPPEDWCHLTWQTPTIFFSTSF